MKFVTGNIHKWEEANAIVWGNLERVEIDLEEIQEIDILKIVGHKAKNAYKTLGEPALCEDVGLVFEARNGLPGPQIKRFSQTVGGEGMTKMLNAFENRKAKAICCVGRFDGKEVHHVMGICEGSIAPTPQGTSNFWRDPIFIPNGYSQTFAEIKIEEKNLISHRYLAWKQIKDLI